MEEGIKIEINPLGIINGRCKRNDGKCIFGSGSDSDFKVSDSEECEPRHFVIQYNLKRNAYYLRDLKEGTGTSVKLEDPFVLS